MAASKAIVNSGRDMCRQYLIAVGWDSVAESANDTDDLWYICEAQDYPKLTRQFAIGDFDGDGDTDIADSCIFTLRWLRIDSSF